ncbi:YciI family protein [Sphaerisporangium flaviroseum]|uniref:YciI family protein n=1 Tax=Sphaerisporangium flaviroseum TaxID=509199 RepID=UPI0031E5E865
MRRSASGGSAPATPWTPVPPAKGLREPFLVAATDGPYAEAKEFFCGYYLVDCESRERAIAPAAQIPDARYTGIEVWPLMSEGGTES